jgi:DNA-binding PadR family transcriptional regulator
MSLANRGGVDVGRELLILGILRGQPLSAYAVDKTVRVHSPLYRLLNRGNIYHLVHRLADEGFLQRKNAIAKRGPSPSKIVFALSANGEKRFQELLARVMLDAQSPESSLEIAMVLIGELPRARGIALLRERDRELARQERRVRRLFGDLEARSAPGFLAGTHALHALESERTFLRDALRRLQNRRWHPEWA